MRKVCIITTNRSDYSRLKPVAEEIKKRNDLQLQLIVTASHLLKDFGDTIDDIKTDKFDITAVARTIIEGEDPVAMAKSVGVGALELPTLLNIYKPDIVVVHGDRFDVLPAAISAALMNIHLAHIQGGEVTGNIDESIRHAITKLSHFHFPATKEAAERIIKLGEDPSKVFVCGCPSMDYFKKYENVTREELIARNAEFNKKHGVNADFSKPYILLIQHPVTTEFETVGKQMKEVMEAVALLKMQTIMIYPNIDAGSVKMISVIRGYEDKTKYPFIWMFKHILFEDFIPILKFASCVVGNSSTITRESCFFGVPAVNIGTRQSGRQRGKNVVDVGYDRNEIKKAIEEAIKVGRYPPEAIYGNGGAGKKIAEILATVDLGPVQKKIRY